MYAEYRPAVKAMFEVSKNQSKVCLYYQYLGVAKDKQVLLASLSWPRLFNQEKSQAYGSARHMASFQIS